MWAERSSFRMGCLCSGAKTCFFYSLSLSPPLSLSLSLPLCLSAFKLELNESIESSRLGHLGACPKKFFSRGAVDDQLCEPSLGVEPVTLM